MIYRKAWSKRDGAFTYIYTGWFLLGFIPIYIRRDRI